MLKTRVLGRTGFEVTEMGFGAWAIGGGAYGDVSESDARECIDAYLDAGDNFIDTARAYGNSEERLGDVISARSDRDRIFLTTKTQASGSPERFERIRTDCETALRLMQTDVIDLYYLHSPPDDVDTMNRAIDEFEVLKDEGKIRAIGASIKGPSVSQATVDLCRQYIDSGRIDAIQLIYSILRPKTGEVLDYAKENGVGIVARTVLESGFLTGKFKLGSDFSSDHRKRWSGATLDRVLSAVDDLAKSDLIAPYDNLTQLAIRYALEPPGVSTAIVGAKNGDQMRRNMAVDNLPPVPEATLVRLREIFGGKTEAFNPGS